MEAFGLLFFFGRSTKVHCRPWEEHRLQGGVMSILHATCRALQKSHGLYFLDLYDLGPGCTDVDGVSSNPLRKSVGDSEGCAKLRESISEGVDLGHLEGSKEGSQKRN
jgi:hypothetical protein